MAARAAVGDMPTFASSNYASNTYAGNDFFTPVGSVGGLPIGGLPTTDFVAKAQAMNMLKQQKFEPDIDHVIDEMVKKSRKTQDVQKKQETNMNDRRLVQVLIVDPNDNISLEQCLIYKGEPKLTDATDQELFFDIDIKSLLAAHNDQRVKVVDKKVKDRTEFLEPAKVRDLKMVVVTIASF